MNPKTEEVQINQSLTVSNIIEKNPYTEQDLVSPEEKLKKMEEDNNLEEEEEEDNQEKEEKLDEQEKLIKKRILTSLVYGENSIPVRDCHLEIAEYYNSNDQPQSSARHYQKAKEISEKVGTEEGTQQNFDAEEEIQQKIAIGLAESYFQQRKENKSNVASANRTLKPILDQEVSDEGQKFRRDLLHARLLAFYQKHPEAVEIYQQLNEQLESNIKKNEELGEIYSEMGDEFSQLDRLDDAKAYYEKSIQEYESYEQGEDPEKNVSQEIQEVKRKLEATLDKKEKHEIQKNEERKKVEQKHALNSSSEFQSSHDVQSAHDVQSSHDPQSPPRTPIKLSNLASFSQKPQSVSVSEEEEKVEEEEEQEN